MSTIKQKTVSSQQKTVSEASVMIVEWLKIICTTFIVMIIIKSLLLDIVVVHQTSMFPTLKEDEKLFLFKQAYTFSDPQRGDIIVFRSEEKLLVKRLIGLPGDMIEIKEKQLYINGKLYDESYLPDTLAYYPDFSVTIVAPDCYFVLGDNRPVSLDSRSFGSVSENDILGKIVLRFSPFSLF